MDLMKPIRELGRMPQWIDYDHMRVYVRPKAIHAINNEVSETFDVANVEVTESKRGQGIFTNWLKELQKYLPTVHNSFVIIYVENVLNERLQRYLVRNDYTLVNRTAENLGIPCYYKICRPEEKVQPQSVWSKLVVAERRIIELENAMQTFVDRCETGEVRSTKTYNQFKQLLQRS